MAIAKEQAKMRRNAARRAHTIFVDYNVCSATEEERYHDLISDIFYEHDELCYAYGRDFSVVNLRKTMNELLSERDVDIIKLRYGLDNNIPHTLEEIGQIYGLTRQRIHKTLVTSFGKLYIKSFRYSLTKRRIAEVTQSIALLDLSTRTYSALINADITSIRDLSIMDKAKLEQIYFVGKQGSYEIIEQLKKYCLSNAPKDAVGNHELTVLNLSSRSYNALIKAGVYTIDDLCLLCKEELLKIKNIGINSAVEITTKLISYISQNSNI